MAEGEILSLLFEYSAINTHPRCFYYRLCNHTFSKLHTQKIRTVFGLSEMVSALLLSYVTNCRSPKCQLRGP
jgi:hypothetical protein